MRPRDFVCTLLFCFTVLIFCILPAAAADSDVCGANAVWHFDETSAHHLRHRRDVGYSGGNQSVL